MLRRWLGWRPGDGQSPTHGAPLGRSWWSRARAALIAWRERWRGMPPGDDSHVFQPRAYPGSRARYYAVHVPHGFSGPRPLLVVLHGCRQNHRDIEAISGFSQLADRHGFLVAYPFITSYSGLRYHNCWGWWFDREIHRGAGEVEDVWQIVAEIKARYQVAERRIHVTGLSSGAGMAVALMVARADGIASGAVVAGIPYSEWPEAVQHLPYVPPRHKPVELIVRAMKAELGDTRQLVPVQIVHSRNDTTVGIQAAKNLRDSWGQCLGIDTQHAGSVRNGRTGNSDWEHSEYRNGKGASVVETLFLEGPGHGWYGGNPGRFSFPDAIDVASCNWEFFGSHPLRG
jgi:poly(hydroxyalkanoate) depolymerase family esterase